MLMTVQDLERDSKISRHTWRAWIRQGKVPIIRVGRCVRVELAAYRAFLAEHANEKAKELAPAIKAAADNNPLRGGKGRLVL